MRPEGLKPPIFSFVGCCPLQLGHGRIAKSGRWGNRTPGRFTATGLADQRDDPTVTYLPWWTVEDSNLRSPKTGRLQRPGVAAGPTVHGSEVRPGGVEPPPSCEDQVLSLAWLPLHHGRRE